MSKEEFHKLSELMMSPERILKFQDVAKNRVIGLTSLYDKVHDPHNIGACIRSAEGFGLTDVHCILPNNFRSHRKITATSDRWVNVHTYTSQDSFVQPYKNQGYKFFAALPHRDSKPFNEVIVPEKCVLVFGAEKWGISPELESICDERITIPMVGFTESLNISTAHAILVQYFADSFRKRGFTLSEEEQKNLVEKWIKREIEEKTRGLISL